MRLKLKLRLDAILMKRVVIIAVISLLMVTSVYAATRVYTNKSVTELQAYLETGNANLQVVDAEQALSQSKYLESVKLYNDARKQTALLKNQMDRLNYDNQLFPKKREQQRLLEKHRLQVNYYSVCLAQRSLEVIESELAMLAKQILVEEEKLLQGDSTQLKVDELKQKKIQAETTKAATQATIEQNKNLLRASLNATTEQAFDPAYVIPESAEGTDSYDSAQLKKTFKDRSLSVLQLKATIGLYDPLLTSLKECVGEADLTYGQTQSEKAKALADLQVLNQTIDAYVERSYNQYKQALANYTVQQANKGLNLSKQVVLNTKYASGDISELQYLTEQYLLKKEMYGVNAAIVDKINAQSLMVLLINGMIVE